MGSSSFCNMHVLQTTPLHLDITAAVGELLQCTLDRRAMLCYTFLSSDHAVLRMLCYAVQPSALTIVLRTTGGGNTKSATMAAQSQPCTWSTVSPLPLLLYDAACPVCQALHLPFLYLVWPIFTFLCTTWQQHTAAHD